MIGLSGKTLGFIVKMHGKTLVAGLILAMTVCRMHAASPEFVADCKALTATAHRLTGTGESRQAGDYLQKRLEAISPDDLIVQEFPTVKTTTKRCQVVVGDKVLRLYPARPNGIITPVSPPEGIKGRLIHGGGDARVFSEKTVRDAIVVLDYNNRHWVTAFRLGARAVIFTGPAFDDGISLYSYAQANLPRYFYDGDATDFPEGVDVTINSEVVWEEARGRNIIAFFKGTNPVFYQEKDELVVLAANIDTFGEIPELTPGARGAANCAALLKLAARIKAHPPRRHTALVFFDARARCHTGASVFYTALEDGSMGDTSSDLTIEARFESVDGEEEYSREICRLLAGANPFGEANTKMLRLFLTKIRTRAKAHANSVKHLSFEAGKKKYQLEQELAALKKKGKPTAGYAERIAGFKQESERFTEQKEQWNDLQRALGKNPEQRMPMLAPVSLEKYDLIRNELSESFARRQQELVVKRALLDADVRLNERIGNTFIALHIAFILGDARPAWGLRIGVGGSHMYNGGANGDVQGIYAKLQEAFLASASDLEDVGTPLKYFVTASGDGITKTEQLFPARTLTHSGEMAGCDGIYNVALATCQDRQIREGTPGDTLSALDLDVIEQQADEIATVLLANGERALLSRDDLSIKRSTRRVGGYCTATFKPATKMFIGPKLMTALPGSVIANVEKPGAVVQFGQGGTVWPTDPLLFDAAKPCAFENSRIVFTDENGMYSPGRISGGLAGYVFAADFDERGQLIEAPVKKPMSTTDVTKRFEILKSRGSYFFAPPNAGKMMGPSVSPVVMMNARSKTPLQTSDSFCSLDDGIVHWYVAKQSIEDVQFFSKRLFMALNNGAELLESEPNLDAVTGIGFAVDPTKPTFVGSARCATDLWRLNGSRLELLRSKNIMDSSLSELHARAEDILIAAADEKSPARSEALAAASQMASLPIYARIAELFQDLVFAVLILLLLSIPFAYALERVLVGSTNIYRRLLWMVLFFGITFLLLYVSHPAFEIAARPFVIFLGFAIGGIAITVICILMRKFETELKVLEGIAGTVHSNDVSRANTFMAAVQMGISTMRRRPMRTALTALTVVLLTFTILCFASFDMKKGITRIYFGPTPGYSGSYLHSTDWSPLSRELAEMISQRWRDEARVCNRMWVEERTVSSISGLQTVSASALGFGVQELKSRPDLAAVFGADLTGKIAIPGSMASEIGVAVGDEVVWGGVRLQVSTIFAPAIVLGLEDMDGASILPVDFTEGVSVELRNLLASQGETSVPVKRNWTRLTADATVVVSDETAFKTGGKIAAVSVYADNILDAERITNELARGIPLPVAGTRRDGTHMHLLGTTMSATGVRDLFFPIVLGGLVIFGTMLGSVSDREREIYTFSALGLAPRHVAMLFFAESMIFAVLGGMGGYLLAQLAKTVLTALSEHGLMRVPEMNVSSTNTIVTILIVMATVMVSAIYPARKAASSANPGLLRLWRPPAPKGNVLDMVFPFTVSEYDITGVVSFLKEYFSDHSDAGLGQFMSVDAELVKDEKGMLGLDATIVLAPFDLGVTQTFELRSRPSEIAGIDEVGIRLERVSGQPSDWTRLSKVFLDALRKQFLLWRAMPDATMEMYRDRTLREFGPNKSA